MSSDIARILVGDILRNTSFMCQKNESIEVLSQQFPLRTWIVETLSVGFGSEFQDAYNA